MIAGMDAENLRPHPTMVSFSLVYWEGWSSS
jgi:hypothetical protein